jgi:hypothetical protein
MSMQRNGGDAGIDPGMVRIRQRLRALRSRYPGTSLTTDLTHIQDEQVVVRAALAMPDGSAVTAYAAEPIDETGMLDGAIELAEQRATTRVLDLLGVGDFGAETRRPAARERRPEAETGSRIDPASLADTSPTDDADAELDDATVAESATEDVETREAVPPAQDQEPVDTDDEPDLADYTWTHLWSWARMHGLTNRIQVEERIGRPIEGLGPREIRQLLQEAGVPL